MNCRKTTIAFLSIVLFVFLSANSFAASSVVIQPTKDGTEVEVVSVPEGTTHVEVAVLKKPTSNESETQYPYPWLSATLPKAYKPTKAEYPVVDMIARGSSNQTIGNWAGRVLTKPAPPKEETQAEKEAREKAERELKEKQEQEAKEKAEKEQKEKEEREKEPPKEELPGSMIVGLDTGGWIGETAVTDFSGAVKYIRSTNYNYKDDLHVGRLAQHGVHLMPLFEDRGDGSLEPASTIANEVRTWFQKYGKGGTYWAGKVDLGATTAEIVNEPGNPYFWGSNARTNQSQYANIIEQVSKAVSTLTYPPRLLVSYDGGFEGDNYGRQLVKTDPNLLKLNIGWTVHPYGGKSSREQSALGGRTRVTESLHPVYVTEVGWPTCVGCSPTGDSLQWTEQEQANNITNFMNWARGLKYVFDVDYFNYADYGTNAYYGIVNSSATRHKISYNTLHEQSLK